MKSFREFCSEANEISENAALRVAGGVGSRIVGRTSLGRGVRAGLIPTDQLKGPARDMADIALSGVGMGPLAPAAVGITALSKLLRPVGKKLHQVRGQRDSSARKALSTAPSTKNMSPGEREELVRATRPKGV